MNTKKHLTLIATTILALVLVFALGSCGLFGKDKGNTDCQHSYSEQVIAPTCTQEGYTLHTCSQCEDSYTDSNTPAIGHTYTSVVVAPTCTTEGYTAHTCSVCADTYNDTTVPVTAHRFNAGPCLFCSMPQPTDEIIPDTEWYSDSVMVFTLNTKEQLAGFASLVNEGHNFKNIVVYLGADIDLGYLAWIPIGNESCNFAGTFDGKGHVISNLRIFSTSSYVGLFGHSTGKISNLTVDNATVYCEGANEYVSVLVGYTMSDITNVQVDGYVDADNSNYVGGVAGCSTAQLSDIVSDTDVVGRFRVGGIVGDVSCATAVYNNLTNYGDVKGENLTAGVFGYLYSTGVLYVENANNYGTIVGTKNTAGIFGYVCGKHGSAIISSTCSASVTGECYVGAIAGEAINVVISSCSNEGSSISATSCEISQDKYYAYLGGYVGKGYSVDNCTNYSTISYVSRGAYVGGIAGYLSYSVSECTNIAPVTGYEYVGGIAGYVVSPASINALTLINATDVTGKAYVGGIAGQWQYSGTFALCSSSNSGRITGTHYVGGICGAVSYTSSNIFTAYDLTNTGDVSATEHMVGGIFGFVNGNTSSVIKDVTSSANIKGLYCVGGIIGGADGVTLKDSSNEGSTVSATGFVINGDNSDVYLGGYVGYGYSVFGCTNDVDITYSSLGRYVGGIAGHLAYNVSDCVNNAKINSLGAYVGGIVGRIESRGLITIANLTNNGEITGTNYVAGIIGYIWNQVNAQGTWQSKHYYILVTTASNLTNTGAVTGDDHVGGILGDAYLENLWTGRWYNCCDYYSKCDQYGYLRLDAKNFTNSGMVSGKTNVGELIGNLWSDGGSTVTTYSILDTLTVGNEVREGEYAVGYSTSLALSGKVLPEVEGDTDTGDSETE